MSNRMTVKQVVLTALMTAMVYLAGSIIKVPTWGGFVHIGDCMVLTSAVVLGSKKGAFASGVGMLLVDVLGGYVIWAPFTFVIKFVMALIAGTIIEKCGTRNTKTYLMSFIPASIFMVFAYFIAGAVIVAFLSGEELNLITGFVFAAKDIPGNILQVVTGVIIAVPLCAMLLKADHFLHFTTQ